MDHKRLKTVVGNLVCIVLIGVFCISTIAADSPNFECRLSNKEPLARDIGSLRNVSDTNDLRSLVTFDGYLIYEGTSSVDDGYDILPLSLESISFKDHDGLDEPSWLMLKTNCANIRMELGYIEPVSVYEILINFTASNRGENFPKVECEILNPPMGTRKGNHYTCSKPKSYRCSTKSKGQVTLFINKLEFEVYGGPSSIERGIYSTPGQTY